MDMNQFRNYLTDINNSLNAPQKGLSPIYEGKKMKEAGKMYEYGTGPKKNMKNEDFTNEDVVREYLSSFFGGELNEDTSDEAIFEAVDTLNIICGELTEYFLSEDEDIEPSDIVTESLDAIFGDDLTEDTSDEDIVAILEGLNAVTTIVNEYFDED
tara:strand:- start:2442 stop:2909 length:468 start_codon:yes stop_codon:yes gene_type:complete